MKKLMTLMLALTFALGTVAVTFAQQPTDPSAPKKDDTKKKKKKSSKKKDDTTTPKKDGGTR